MKNNEFLIHSRSLPPGKTGKVLSLSRQRAHWQSMSFFVHSLAPGDSWKTETKQEEMAAVLLGGRGRVNWGEGEQPMGRREHVFDGLPYALYLPPHSQGCFRAETTCEIAECRVRSTARLVPRLVTPADVEVSLRGGGNASRQIVNVMGPDFPADRLVVVEVYTPSGNWSSYPPHKHDEHKPPEEADLDEIYYYRMAHPAGYALQRLYKKNGQRDRTLTARDGDVILVRDGYHPVVAGHGYHVYYLNFLAGSLHSLANTEDPEHVWVRSEWKEMDPRLPLVRENL